MALFRQVSRAPRLVSQCQKLGAVFQTHRGYADMPEMAFTLASPSDVCKPLSVLVSDFLVGGVSGGLV